MGKPRLSLFWLGCGLLGSFAAVAALAPLLAPYDPHLPIGRPLMSPTAEHPLGTNDIGQDVLSLLLHGARTSLVVAAVVAAFDGGRLTSDGGLPLVAEADRWLGLSAALAACVPEWRRGAVTHSIEDLVRQRVYQIACGYEDPDDADSLRTDPLLKLVHLG